MSNWRQETGLPRCKNLWHFFFVLLARSGVWLLFNGLLALFVFFVLRHPWVWQVFTPRMSPKNWTVHLLFKQNCLWNWYNLRPFEVCFLFVCLFVFSRWSVLSDIPVVPMMSLFWITPWMNPRLSGLEPAQHSTEWQRWLENSKALRHFSWIQVII